jgi:hypothetical protein
MANIWTFGDSFTKHNRKEYIDWKGREPQQWPNYLANKLDLGLYNLGQGGLSNYGIFVKVCDNSDLFETNDIVIIGWGLLSKFRIIQDNNFFDVHPNDSRTEFAYYQDNRKHNKWVDEIKSWENLLGALGHAKNFTIITWSFEEPLLDDRRYFEFETISEETNNEINDDHLSEKGHNDLAEYFITLL